jgi:hypothetical protein
VVPSVPRTVFFAVIITEPLPHTQSPFCDNRKIDIDRRRFGPLEFSVSKGDYKQIVRDPSRGMASVMPRDPVGGDSPSRPTAVCRMIVRFCSGWTGRGSDRFTFRTAVMPLAMKHSSDHPCPSICRPIS